MSAYYNENDSFAAAWLRELIRAGHIAGGDVDERSIEDVKPGDLRGYRQCHFFAGIGGWSYALRLAGWPDDQPVWTGSCPCQPFSAAGQRAGFADERHLWPTWFHLIQQCRPPVVFGEQVASKAAEPWIDLVQSDLEAMDYAFGCVPFPAAGVGAPHIRDRAYWVANTNSQLSGKGGSVHRGRNTRSNAKSRTRLGGSRVSDGNWANSGWVASYDGQLRPIEPHVRPLAHGVPARVGRLRGYGNAIVTEAAAQFVLAAQESGLTA